MVFFVSMMENIAHSFLPNQYQAWLTEGNTPLDEAKIVTVDMLWQACTNYQNERLDANGVSATIGKLMLGSVAGVTYVKATANKNWWQELWSDYNIRKKALASGDSISLDFSGHGDIPYPVQEMIDE